MGLWWAGEPVFDAGVRVCAPVLEVGVGPSTPAGPVRRWSGRAFDVVAGVDPPRAAIGESWSLLLGAFHGTPEIDLGAGATLSAIATASAGFRDEYYGIVPHVAEATEVGADHGAEGVIQLVTSGLIDPLRCRWGSAPARFARARWAAPVVDLEGLRRTTPRLAAWADQRLVPKVVLAGQTRVLEAAVDVDGCWWPSVPTIAVVPSSPEPAELWRIAAALASPAATAWALGRFGGSALSSDAVKVSAGQVLGLPLPTDRAAWQSGAAAAEVAHEASCHDDRAGWDRALGELGTSMADAYGVGHGVAEWWTARRPVWR